MVSNDAGALESKPFFDEPKLRHLKLSSSRTELRIELFWHMRCSALLSFQRAQSTRSDGAAIAILDSASCPPAESSFELIGAVRRVGLVGFLTGIFELEIKSTS